MTVEAQADRRRQDLYPWRVLATGLAFLTFGVFGILFRLLVYPPLRLLVRDPERRRRWARTILRVFFRIYIGVLKWTGAMAYTIHNAAGLTRPGTLVVANHPSLFDVVLLIAFVPNACCVVKQSLWDNAVMRGPLEAAGYISNGDPQAMLALARADLQTGAPIIIFPEGTRTERGGRPRFGRSAANLSVRSRRPIVPVFIACEPTTLTRNERWYEVPYKRVHFSLTVGPECEPPTHGKAHGETDEETDGQSGVPTTILVRRQQDRLNAFFEHMLEVAAAQDKAGT